MKRRNSQSSRYGLLTVNLPLSIKTDIKGKTKRKEFFNGKLEHAKSSTQNST